MSPCVQFCTKRKIFKFTGFIISRLKDSRGANECGESEDSRCKNRNTSRWFFDLFKNVYLIYYNKLLHSALTMRKMMVT